MKMSKHAMARAQQRGIDRNLINLIVSFGEHKPRPGNTFELKLNKKDKNYFINGLRQLINKIDKCSNKSVIVDNNFDKIITVYHKR
jgi:hypothetical protein